MSDLIKNYQDATEQIETIKKKLQMKINSALEQIKDASYVRRLSDNPSCFVIQSSDLGNDWSPEHHDCKLQAQCLMKYIDTHSIELIMKEFEFIKENKKWSSNRQTNKTGIRLFNNEFISQVFY